MSAELLVMSSLFAQNFWYFNSELRTQNSELKRLSRSAIIIIFVIIISVVAVIV